VGRRSPGKEVWVEQPEEPTVTARRPLVALEVVAIAVAYALVMAAIARLFVF
jgi:hypothetical protein